MAISNRSQVDIQIPALVLKLWPERQVTRIEPVLEGVSTYVYRILCGEEVMYLRVLPEANASFVPEAVVHDLLRTMNVHIPDVLYVEASNPLINRSLLLTTAIDGQPINNDIAPECMAGILFQAGKELALINSIPVQGFGWIRRDEEAGACLLGEFITLHDWVQTELDQALIGIEMAKLVTADETSLIRMLMNRAIELFADEPSCLAHGDFDTTHIFHAGDIYTGIIDFGEIRGAPALYDLAHFQIEHSHLLPHLLAGFATVRDLPYDVEGRLALLSLFIAVRRVGRRALKRASGLYPPDRLAIRNTLKRYAPGVPFDMLQVDR